MYSISMCCDLLHILLNQFDEHKDEVAVEQILRVVFLDVERPSPVSLRFSKTYVTQHPLFSWLHGFPINKYCNQNADPFLLYLLRLWRN